MSRFYSTFGSDCTKMSTKRGHRYISAHVRGWDIGLETYVGECLHGGADVVRAYETAGSNDKGNAKLVFERCSADCQK